MKTRRVHGYYHNLLNPEDDAGDNKEPNGSLPNDHESIPKKPEKWKGQIEKVTRYMDLEPQSFLLWFIEHIDNMFDQYELYFAFTGFAQNFSGASCFR